MSQDPEALPLRVDNLVKRYSSGAGVEGVSLTAPAGRITGFIGVNGAGKSTTLRCVLGLAAPDAGRIEIFGRPASFAARVGIGFLPEERGLSPRERARDLVAFYARLKGMTARDAFRRADTLLERVGLGGRRRARIGELSKGNAQRVQLLCAMVHDPALLILDEPFSGLDPVGQAEVQALFAEHRAKGGAILFSTHSLAAAETLCDRVVILSGGRTVFEGSVADATQMATHGALVTCPDPAGLLEAVAQVGGSASPLAGRVGEAVRWRVVLPRHVTHPVLLRALAEREVTIYGFEPMKTDLEGAFWRLAGPDHQTADAEPLSRAA
jgi:ABC-2 type transport system ATP-binding protein